MYRKLIVVVIGVCILATAGLKGSDAAAGTDAAKAKAPVGKKSEGPGPEAALAGKVIETMNAGGYTYVRLDRGTDKIWIAAPEFKVKVGEELIFAPGNAMPNFKSESLHRTFELIVFSSGPVTLPGSKGETAAKKKKDKAVSGATEKVKVGKATGPNAFTVSELYGKRASLDKKEVSVRGKVVKVSANIMGKNWVHLVDGTGEADKGTDRIVVTTDGTASVGDTVTATGILAKDKDFGYGYRYDVIIEKASIKK